MTTKTSPKSSELPEKGATTFKCQLCGETKPLDEVLVSTRFFPPLIVCRECDKE